MMWCSVMRFGVVWCGVVWCGVLWLALVGRHALQCPICTEGWSHTHTVFMECHQPLNPLGDVAVHPLTDQLTDLESTSRDIVASQKSCPCPRFVATRHVCQAVNGTIMRLADRWAEPACQNCTCTVSLPCTALPGCTLSQWIDTARTGLRMHSYDH